MGESRSTDVRTARSSDARLHGQQPAERGAPEEAFLHALVDASGDALWAESTEGVVVAWNRAAERLFGWKQADIVGRPAHTFLTGAQPAPDIEPDGIRRCGAVAVRPDHSTVDIAVTISPVLDDHGRRAGSAVRARAIADTAERMDADRLLRLDQTLAAGLEPDAILDTLADALVPALADACVTYIPRKNGTVRRVRARHADPARQGALERILAIPEPSLDDAGGPGAVLRTGVPNLILDLGSAQLDAEGVHGRATLRGLDFGTAALLPLRARDRIVGAVLLLMSRDSERVLADAVTSASTLADRAALALDNAQLFSAAQAELARRHLAEEALRQRFEHLGVVYHMTEAVGRAGALESIYDEALDGLRRGIHVDRAAILLADDNGVMRFRAWRGISEGYRGAVEGHNPWSADDLDPQPIVIADVDVASDLPAELMRTVHDEGIRAMAFVPLVFQQHLLGKFMLYFDAPRVLRNEELALAQTIAGTIAFAIARVRAEQSVRVAREVAEHASHAKSQFLGVMSHELRTPLNAVLGYADLLLMEVRGPLSEGQREQIERIRVSAQHQLQLIEELLTYTRLQAGREEARLVPVDLRRVVADVAEFVRPEADRKGLHLRVELPDEPLDLVTDPAKLRQIILNFAANATKFTAAGEVTLGAARVLDGFAVRVRDTGPGIPAEKIDYIFEPFAQASEGSTRNSGGTGLGLAIARRFADLLGAHIDVRTRPGAGATFILRLPEAPPLATVPSTP